MLLGEWLHENHDFVDEIDLPSSIDHELIEYILKIEYGEKLVHKPMQNLTGIEVAKFVNMRYNSKWLKVFEYLESVEIGTVNSKDIVENFDGSITVNQSGDVVNLESAFNTEDFVNSDKQENTLENQHSNLNTRTRKENYISTYTGNKQVMNYNNTQLSNVVVKDIVNELCLKIY